MQRRAGEFRSNVVSSTEDTLSHDRTVIVPRKAEMGWAAHLGIVRCSADSQWERNAGRNYRKTSLRRQQKKTVVPFRYWIIILQRILQRFAIIRVVNQVGIQITFYRFGRQLFCNEFRIIGNVGAK